MDYSDSLCMGCMNKLEADGSCSHCGYTAGSPYIKIYLPPKTVLASRYLVGKVLSYNGDGASYIGYDMAEDKKIVVHEYMPECLSTRTPDKTKVVVSSASVEKYKTYMAEFAELNKTLSGLKNITNIVPAIDMFAENNTMYAITPYIEGISLKKFLQSGNKLTWAQTKKIFPPIFTALGLIHNSGIIHGGICPENTLITTRGEIKLIGFSISATRVQKSELTSDLHPGYAAPEQYGDSEFLGTYTDVYGMCAVLYKILTGVAPPSGKERANLDRIAPAGQLNPDVPKHVSDALMRGLSVDYKERIQTITELVTELFAEPSQVERQSVSYAKQNPQRAAKQQYIYDDYDDEDEDDDEEDDGKRRNLTGTVITAVILAVIVGIGLYLLADMFTPNSDDSSIITTSSVSSSSSQTETAAPTEATEAETTTEPESTEVDYGTGAIMPGLVGLSYATVESSLETDFEIEINEVTSDEYEEGIIISQSIPEGVEYNPTGGLTLTLEVSAGSGKVALPEYEGKVSSEYLSDLKDAGIDYYYDYETSTEIAYGYITRVMAGDEEIKPGEEVDVLNNVTVTVYISLGNS